MTSESWSEYFDNLIKTNMKPETAIRMVGTYEGAETMRMQILFQILEGKTIDEIKSYLKEIETPIEKDKEIWHKRYQDSGSWSGYAQQPTLSKSINV